MAHDFLLNLILTKLGENKVNATKRSILDFSEIKSAFYVDNNRGDWL